MRKPGRSSFRVFLIGTNGLPVEKEVVVVKEGCKYFFNAQHYLIQLERGERAFYDYLCEQMDSYNRVTISAQLRENFVQFVNSVSSKKRTYSTGSLSKYIQTLMGMGLLIRSGSKNSGYYTINPKYAFAGPENARVRLLRTMITQGVAAKKDISALIHVPQDLFLKKLHIETADEAAG